MHFPKALALATLFSAYVYADATVFFTGNGACSGAGTTQTVPGDGACRELGGINAAETTNIGDVGCSVTVYADSSCSVDATTAGLGACIVGTINSFSYDC